MALQQINWLQINTKNIPSGSQVILASESNPLEWVYTKNLFTSGGFIVSGSVNENSNISFRLVPEEVRKFLDRVVGDRKQKHCADWCKGIISLDLESIKAFLQAFWLADGYTTAIS